MRIHLSAQGEVFDQRMAREMSALRGFVLVASRYEGLDQRVVDSRIDRELSIGDFVLSGGEFAALAVIDAVVRLLPGALGDERSSERSPSPKVDSIGRITRGRSSGKAGRCRRCCRAATTPPSGAGA